MVLMKKGSIAAAIVAVSMCFGHAAFSQDATTAQTETSQQSTHNFTEDELKSFVEANTKATEIKKEGRAAVVAAIEEQNLTVDRFNEMAKAHRQKKLEEIAEGPEEISAFSNAAQAVVKIQPETNEKVEQAIEEQGLTVEKYETILQAYEKDEAVQAQIRKIVNTAE